MPLDPTRLMTLEWPARRVAVHDRDAMLYAIAAGLGAAPDESELSFVYEKALAIVPSFANSLAFDDAWIVEAGVDLASVVHGGLDLEFHAPLRAPGEVSLTTRIVGLDDKGPGKGGVILQETQVSQDGALRCAIASSLFVRGAGGFGGSLGRRPDARKTPDRSPDATIDIATTRNQALLFRLLGDRNLLHVDPSAARAAGFDRPILHGASTFATVCAALLRAFCDLDPARLKRMAARFSGPVYPGETLALAVWREAGALAFRASVRERGATALDGGYAEIRP